MQRWPSWSSGAISSASAWKRSRANAASTCARCGGTGIWRACSSPTLSAPDRNAEALTRNFPAAALGEHRHAHEVDAAVDAHRERQVGRIAALRAAVDVDVFRIGIAPQAEHHVE